MVTLNPVTRKLILAFILLFNCFLANALESEVAPDQRRGVEQTFLTFPEWYLVHSPAEFACFISQHPAHEFPFIGHIKQLWSSYGSVTEEQWREKYPANIGYHVMIWVIASSTTLEYGIRSVYENTLGRTSWTLSSGKLTDEDLYAAEVAQDYVDFIRKEPWYLYNFSAKLKGLWSSVPAIGSNMIRKWERRYALTTEYLIKAAYGKAIEFATREAYEPALMTTQVIADHMPTSIPPDLNIKIVRQLADGRVLLDLPRYFDFRIAATRLAQQACKLVDIAGNTSVILVSVWATDKTDLNVGNNRVLFEQPLITMPGYKRVALVLPVAEISDFLLMAPEKGLQVEHVYDY